MQPQTLGKEGLRQDIEDDIENENDSKLPILMRVESNVCTATYFCVAHIVYLMHLCCCVWIMLALREFILSRYERMQTKDAIIVIVIANQTQRGPWCAKYLLDVQSFLICQKREEIECQEGTQISESYAHTFCDSCPKLKKILQFCVRLNLL